MPVKPNRQITTVTAPSVDILSKNVVVARTDTTAFNAFALPKDAFIYGVFVMGQTASDADTSATISVGTNPATTNEILNNIDVKGIGKGFFAANTSAGSAVGTKLTADTLYKAIYVPTGAETTGGPWLVRVDYYMPQQGDPY